MSATAGHDHDPLAETTRESLGAAVLRRRTPIILLAALVYGGMHLLWYWQTPLGRIPVLDERENIELALQLASGAVPPEPFYRAMGYPLLLAGFLHLGISVQLLPLAASGFGLLLHVVGTILVSRWAGRIFASDRAALLAGLAHGLNPVLIHYATQIQDGTLANTLFVAGGLLLSSENRTVRRSAAAGLCWALAALVRPQYIAVWFLFPVITWSFCGLRLPLRRIALLAGAGLASGAIPLVIVGLVQQQISGAFRVLPTQGAYNLWAANRPGAHGRFFGQIIHLPASETHRNPTRVESEVLYTRETGRPANDIDAVNAHWNQRLAETLRAEPIAWIGRMARKGYYLLNDVDQYNNKTYAVHQARSPWLRWNPLGWGVLLLLAVAGGWCAARGVTSGRAWSLPVLFAVVAAPIVLTLVSGRFRIPLHALLCVAAGGHAVLPAWLRQSARREIFFAAAIIAAFAVVAFSSFFGVRDPRTAVQDHVLIADAASQTGDDAEAWRAAGLALALQPGQPDALAWRVTSFFNLLLTGRADPADEAAWRDAARVVLEPATSPPSDAVANIALLALWRGGEREKAERSWRARFESAGDREALAALCLSGGATRAERDLQRSRGQVAGIFSRLATDWRKSPASAETNAVRGAISRIFTGSPVFDE